MDIRTRQSFNRQGDAFDRGFTILFYTAFGIICLVTVGVVIGWLGIAYTVFHFVSKVW